MIFKLFQINTTLEHRQIDEEGLEWNEALEKFPKVEAAHATMMGGSDAYVTMYDEFYTHVADIDASNLEDAFHIHNMQDENHITRFGRQHSMSVGDVLVGSYGDVHMVDGIGFTQLMSSKIGFSLGA
tara:strand:+ start:340 stop:720 length:381 start_codon:yes stop_codon:yes gene_type:complete